MISSFTYSVAHYIGATTNVLARMEEQINVNQDETCPITLEPIDERISRLACTHICDYGSLIQWYKTKKEQRRSPTCPVCRRVFTDTEITLYMKIGPASNDPDKFVYVRIEALSKLKESSLFKKIIYHPVGKSFLRGINGCHWMMKTILLRPIKALVFGCTVVAGGAILFYRSIVRLTTGQDSRGLVFLITILFFLILPITHIVFVATFFLSDSIVQVLTSYKPFEEQWRKIQSGELINGTLPQTVLERIKDKTFAQLFPSNARLALV